MLDLVVVGARLSLWLYILAGGCFEALGELFSVGPLRLRADHLGGQNYRDFDSRLNLAHPFAASCWCGLGRVSEFRLWLLCLPCYS